MAESGGITSDEIRQVQDYVRREFAGLMSPLRQPIYHYTSGGAAAEILDQAKIRATNILYLDDGREMQHALDYFRRAMATRAAEHPSPVSTELNTLIDAYLSQVGTTVPPDIWIVTFSANRDSARQWEAIAPSGHGVAFGFNPTLLSRAADAGGILLAPCCYDDATKLAIMGRGLDVLERLYERRLRATPRGRADAELLVRYVVRELALFGALMKRSDLAHEAEWRMILCNPCQTAVGARRILSFSKPEYTGLQIEIDLADANDRLPLAEIIAGPSPYQQMTARAFRTLLYKFGYDRIDVSRSET